MITANDIPRCPPALRRQWHELIERWPVGAHVRHVGGWVGQITEDHPGNPLSITGGRGTHVLLTTANRTNGAVCVTWTCDGRPATAWYRPGVLRLEGRPKPTRAHAAPRRRRRSVS